jgi:hypothetical protein
MPVFIYQLQTIWHRYGVEVDNSVTPKTANCLPPKKAGDPKPWLPFQRISTQPQHQHFLPAVSRPVSELPNKELVAGTCARSGLTEKIRRLEKSTVLANILAFCFLKTTYTHV